MNYLVPFFSSIVVPFTSFTKKIEFVFYIQNKYPVIYTVMTWLASKGIFETE